MKNLKTLAEVGQPTIGEGQEKRSRTTCDLYETCLFFEAVAGTEVHADILNEYFRIYCKGPLQEYCQRRDSQEQLGKPLAPKISPSGLDIEYFLGSEKA